VVRQLIVDVRRLKVKFLLTQKQQFNGDFVIYNCYKLHDLIQHIIEQHMMVMH